MDSGLAAARRPGMTLTRRGADQAFGGGAGFGGDFGAGQHACYLLAAPIIFKLEDAGGDPLAVAERVLA